MKSEMAKGFSHPRAFLVHPAPPLLAFAFCLLNICDALLVFYSFLSLPELSFFISFWFCCCSENKSGTVQTMLRVIAVKHAAIFSLTRPPNCQLPAHPSILPSIHLFIPPSCIRRCSPFSTLLFARLNKFWQICFAWTLKNWERKKLFSVLKNRMNKPGAN